MTQPGESAMLDQEGNDMTRAEKFREALRIETRGGVVRIYHRCGKLLNIHAEPEKTNDMTLTPDEAKLLQTVLLHSGFKNMTAASIQERAGTIQSAFVLGLVRSFEPTLGAIETSIKRRARTRKVYEGLVEKLNAAVEA